jgi:hypothetical protein
MPTWLPVIPGILTEDRQPQQHITNCSNNSTAYTTGDAYLPTWLPAVIGLLSAFSSAVLPRHSSLL